jgi:4,5-DOPA dioxygenase extradiol
MNKTKMPVLFCAHGSPMNALAENKYTQALGNLKNIIPTPKAILMVSAHWQTTGTWVTAMEKPKTIHDFHGFPKELFDIQYNPPGYPELAQNIIENILEPKIKADLNDWGLDHGTWSVLRHMYPAANVPVVQLSMDMTKPADFHFQLGKKLNFLREQGVLIIGSGNIVHNLRLLDWNNSAPPFDWTIEYDRWVTEQLHQKNFQVVVNEFDKSPNGILANPSPDHFYPLFYILGAMDDQDTLSEFYTGFEHGSISMRSFIGTSRLREA